MQAVRVSLYGVLSGCGYLLLRTEALGFVTIQVGLSLLFIGGLIFEAKATRHPFFILPPGVFSTYCLVNNMLTGIWYFAGNVSATTQFVVADASVVRGTWYTLIAVQTLWVAFYMLPEGMLRLPGKDQAPRVPPALIRVLLAISLLCFLAAVRLNVFGYVADPTKVQYVTYLRFGINLGLLVIILITAYEWDRPPRRMLLYGVVAMFFLIGILNGSKSAAVMPLLVLMVTMYATGRRVKIRHISFAVLAAVGAYVLIEPFRIYYRFAAAEGEARSVADLARMYAVAQDVVDQSELNYTTAFVERLSYVTPLAKAIEYADENQFYKADEWKNLFLSPFYGTIPRLLWTTKPLADFGHWASVNIFGLPEWDPNSVGITPQGYAYLVARVSGILLCFVVYGLVQRLTFDLLYLNRRFLPVYLALFFDIGYPVTPWTFVAGTLQSLILMAPALLLLDHLSRERSLPGAVARPALT